MNDIDYRNKYEKYRKKLKQIDKEDCYCEECMCKKCYCLRKRPELPEKPREKVPEKIPEKVSEKIPEKVSEKIPEKVSEKKEYSHLQKVSIVSFFKALKILLGLLNDMLESGMLDTMNIPSDKKQKLQNVIKDLNSIFDIKDPGELIMKTDEIIRLSKTVIDILEDSKLPLPIKLKIKILKTALNVVDGFI